MELYFMLFLDVTNIDITDVYRTLSTMQSTVQVIHYEANYRMECTDHKVIFLFIPSLYSIHFPCFHSSQQVRCNIVTLNNNGNYHIYRHIQSNVMF